MAQLTKANTVTKYNDTGSGLFKDNTSGDIGADDARALVTDVTDSALFISDNFIDEDDMASNSATRVPSQQSVKAYVDAQVAGAGEEHFLGVYTDETALTTAHATASPGDYAYVDAGAASPVEMWIWDDDDDEWVQSGGPAGGTWGSITGTLSSQTDLQSALDAKIGSAAVVGVQDLFIPAAAMWPTATDGCSALTQSEIATSLFNIQTLDFDQTTEEHAQFQIVLPRKWNNLTFTFVPYWTASSGTPGQTVRWQMNGGAYANDDSLTTAPGSSIAVDDTLLATNDLHIGAESSPVTLSNTPASADFLMLQIHRGVASDDLAADAKLLGVSIRITTTAAKDA